MKHDAVVLSISMGLYIKLEMPKDVDLVAAQQASMEADVGYHPGPMFSPDGTSGRNCARLCFGYNSPEEIREGVGRLAGVLEGLGYLSG